MVQRYACDRVLGMSPEQDGAYVKYEDYERLKQKFMDYVVCKEKELDSVRNAAASRNGFA